MYVYIYIYMYMYVYIDIYIYILNFISTTQFFPASKVMNNKADVRVMLRLRIGSETSHTCSKIDIT